MDTRTQTHDVELRLVDAKQNRRRVYGITVCRTLFGELCLRVQWGRIGHRPLRERSELFASTAALEQRRAELLERRRRHGYVPVGRGVLAGPQGERPREREGQGTGGEAVGRDVVESHGLALRDRVARELVERWHAAATELWFYVQRRVGGHSEMDLEDVSTLAAMYVELSQSHSPRRRARRGPRGGGLAEDSRGRPRAAP